MEYVNVIKDIGTMIINKTRYSTEVIRSVIEMVRSDLYSSTGESWLWLIDYYTGGGQPYSTGATGPYVKMHRNGDENHETKHIRLVHPDKFTNLSDLEQMVASTQMEAPDRAMLELVTRVVLIFKHGGHAREVPATWQSGVWSKNMINPIMEKLREEGTTLKFSLKNPSSDEVEAQKCRVERTREIMSARRQYNETIVNFKRLEANRKMWREQVERLTVGLARSEEEIKQLELSIERQKVIVSNLTLE